MSSPLQTLKSYSYSSFHDIMHYDYYIIIIMSTALVLATKQQLEGLLLMFHFYILYTVSIVLCTPVKCTIEQQ